MKKKPAQLLTGSSGFRTTLNLNHGTIDPATARSENNRAANNPAPAKAVLKILER